MHLAPFPREIGHRAKTHTLQQFALSAVMLTGLPFPLLLIIQYKNAEFAPVLTGGHVFAVAAGKNHAPRSTRSGCRDRQGDVFFRRPGNGPGQSDRPVTGLSPANGRIYFSTTDGTLYASKGIGAGIAKSLAAEGAAVVVNYIASREGADRVVAEIVGNGGKAVAVQGDVSKAADVQRIFAETRKAFGTLDVLVNNAGVYEFAALGEITEEHFHRQFNTNVLGLILATQEAVKLFGAEGGSLINIGSTASTLTPAATAVYMATKGAVDAVTHVLAKELGSGKFGSTQSIRGWWKPKERVPAE